MAIPSGLPKLLNQEGGDNMAKERKSRMTNTSSDSGTEKENVKRQRNLPSSSIGRTVSSRKILPKTANNNKLSIKEYNLNSINDLSQIENYSNIIELVCICMVTVVMLCQFRSLRPAGNSSKLDQLPSFKYYKRKVVMDYAGQALALAVASSLPDAVVNLPSDPNELERWLLAVLDSYTGNEKLVKNCMENTVTDYVCGHMSRILGLMNSCPAANMQAFNLDTSCVNWGIKDVIERIPISDLPEDIVDRVVSRLRTEHFDISAGPPRFSETPYTGDFSSGGGSKIESEIFGEEMPTRILSGGEAALVENTGKLSEEELSLLSPLELRKYNSAVYVKKKDLINKFKRIVIDRKKKKNDCNHSTKDDQ